MMKFETSSIKNVVLTQVMALCGFVVVPVVITLMAPLTNLEFHQTEAGPRVTVHRFVLVFLPWKTEQVSNVKQIRAEITPQKRYQGTREERRKGQKGVRLATAQVVVMGDGPEVIVQSDPDLAKTIAKQFDVFAANPLATPVVLKVYASWSLSYILGGVATFFCGLYLLGASLAIINAPLQLVRSIWQAKTISEPDSANSF